MTRTILVTGATDGIGLETARRLLEEGHHVLLHGRNPQKVERVCAELASATDGSRVTPCVADLSRPAEADAFARRVAEGHPHLDVVLNNAGVYHTDRTRTTDGLDVRFAVNTLAPYVIARRLIPPLGRGGRVVNVASAAQAPVDLGALEGRTPLDTSAAYAQSKLALIMWTRALADEVGDQGPVLVAVNPGSLLDTKMVRASFGYARAGAGVGADILCRAALAEEFADAAGLYFDNDSGRFAPPHPAALDAGQCAAVVRAMDGVLRRMGVAGGGEEC